MMNAEDIGPTLELIAIDACRLAAGLVEVAEAEALRRTTGHGRIAISARFVRTLIAARRLRPQWLGPEFAPEPGWSVMLALYGVAPPRRLDPGPRPPSTRAAAAPGATTPRPPRRLEDQGMIEPGPTRTEAEAPSSPSPTEAAARMGII